MKQARSINALNHGQRGEALLESLIGILLMAVIGLSLSYVTSRAVFAQRYLNTQNIAVSQIRETMSTTGSASAYCATGTGPTIQVGQVSYALSLVCSSDNVTVAVGGGAGLSSTIAAGSLVTSMTISMTANSTTASIVGGDGSMAVSF